MNPDAFLELFVDAADAVHTAVGKIPRADRRARTDRPGQYALDLVADEAVCSVLERAGVRIVSEESGVHEHTAAEITVVVDPVDGSTNCARGISYWATSLCALDGDGLLAALVVNHPSGERTTAVRGGGAHREGERLRASSVTRLADAVIDLGGWPLTIPRSKQTRVLGSLALVLCDVAAGGIDGHIDFASHVAPWDYLGGLLACREAGAVVRDVNGEELATSALDARRQLVAGGTEALVAELLTSVT